MLGMNFGTAALQESIDFVEYCNAPVGTEFGDLRAKHGFREPHDVRYWCLGNEMDGPWQIGHMDADAYALKALQTAKIIKNFSKENLLTVCGSSGPGMATYPAWDRTVMEMCWEWVDFLSMHDYAENWGNDTPSFLASGIKFQNHLDTIAATLRYVKSKLRSKHDVFIAWDEWNVWYKDRNGDGQWQVAPDLCEEVYNLEDALVVAQWLNCFVRNCDVLKIGCLAQVVNVISPLLTNSEGLLKQSTFYPFVLFAKFAGGVGLDVHVEGPGYETKVYGDAPMLDASGAFEEESARVSVFLVNRSVGDVLPVEIRVGDFNLGQFDDVYQLAGRDPKSANSFEKPNNVVPVKLASVLVKGGVARVLVPPLSFTCLSGELQGH
jgi:alpha-N-arabinofuranosidase